MPVSTLTSKGQLTLPREIREHLEVHEGDRLEFRVDRQGRVWVEPATQDLLKLQGLLGPATGFTPASTGMMSFTPGDEGRISAPATTSKAVASQRTAVYRWSDARGIVLIGSTPPAGVACEKVRYCSNLSRTSD